jgi:small subunit ribosomal protein S6
VSEVKKNLYEAMFLLPNSRVNAENGSGTAIVNALLEKHHGKPVKVDLWDERKLAYPVKDQKRATYILAHFEAPTDAVQKLMHDVNISEDILRALVLAVPEFPIWRTAAEIDALRPRREPRKREDEWEEPGDRRGGWRDRDEYDTRDMDSGSGS